jgi:hypothetical protein
MILKPVVLRFKFDNFADLPSEVDEEVYSEVQTDCNGNKWRLSVAPGGDNRAKKPGCIGVYLFSQNEDSVKLDTRFAMCVKDANGKIVAEMNDFEFEFTSRKEGYGDLDFIQRSIILDAANNILQDEALFIEVTIQVKDCDEDIYQPPNALSERQLKLFKSGERSDVSFIVGDKVFPAHLGIIYANAPILADHCNETKLGEKPKEVIKDVSPVIFQLILEYVYSGCFPSKNDALKYGKELINAANKYELIELKMAVENLLVKERILTTKNVADYILFADAQSTPLLKEYAVSFFLLHCREVLESEHSKCLRDSAELLTEMMLLMNDENKGKKTMSVNELRNELGKRKLDVDGSKETLISRLEEAKRQKTE